MHSRDGCSTCSLARSTEFVKLLTRNCGPRPSGRSKAAPRLTPRVGALLAGAILLGACRLDPAPLERANVLAEHGRETEAIDLLEKHLATHPVDIAERR